MQYEVHFCETEHNLEGSLDVGTDCLRLLGIVKQPNLKHQEKLVIRVT